MMQPEIDYNRHAELLRVLKEMNSILGKMNDRMELLTNPVFLYNPNKSELIPIQRPGSVIPICKCGGFIEEKRDDT